MPNLRNNIMPKTDLANNGKQGSNMSHNTALDAPSDSRDFPDDGPPHNKKATTLISCFQGTRAALARKADVPATTLKTPRQRHNNPNKDSNNCDSAHSHVNTTDNDHGHNSVVYDNADWPWSDDGDMNHVSYCSTGCALRCDAAQSSRSKDDVLTSELSSCPAAREVLTTATTPHAEQEHHKTTKHSESNHDDLNHVVA